MLELAAPSVLEAPEDGDYVFSVASLANAILRMNTQGSDPSGASVVMEETGGTAAFDDSDWKNRTQVISLRKGQRYYMELSRERVQGNRQGNELSLGWCRADDAEEFMLVPKKYLIPISPPLTFLPVDDVANTSPNNSVLIGVLDNDRDFRFQDFHNTECIQVTFAGQAANGTTEIVGDRQILYTPRDGFTGTEKFQYAIQSNTYRDRMRVELVTVHVTDE